MANYAASLYAGEEAHHSGYTQVLWLDGAEHKYVEEVGSMNIFFVIDGELVTPALQGSILPGITRDSVLALAQKWGLKVSEHRLSIEEVFAAHADGKLDESFGAGTAAVISPVGEIKYGDRVIQIGENRVGPLAQRFYDAITSVQYGHSADEMNWIEAV
jgi:branched-chain amino acid aminotransferase